MAVLPLVTQPNRILHTKSRALSASEAAALVTLGEDMIATMLANNGIGLAAPQIGKNIQLFVINKEVLQADDHLVLYNPTITFKSVATTTMEEGCLSCPQQYGNVRRPEKIRVKAYTLDGAKHIFKAKGLLAKVFQHEIDHLLGTLIIDKFEDSAV